MLRERESSKNRTAVGSFFLLKSHMKLQLQILLEEKKIIGRTKRKNSYRTFFFLRHTQREEVSIPPLFRCRKRPDVYCRRVSLSLPIAVGRSFF
jgi:hypothetical protein